MTDDLTDEERKVLYEYEATMRKWASFCSRNPDLVAYLEELLEEMAVASEALESCARRAGKTIGPMVKGAVTERVNPEALRNLMAEEGPDRIIELGGTVSLAPSLSAGALREAVRKDLISPDKAGTLTTRSVSFPKTERYGLPGRRSHD